MSNRVLSSTAERCYWFGRYLERADNTARLVMVNGRLLYDLPKRLPLAWRGLIDITGSWELFDEHFEESTEKNVTRFLVNDTRNSGSLFRSLDAARENIRTLRGIVPRRCVEYVNDLHRYAKETLSEPLSRSRRSQGLAEVQAYVQRIEGFMSANLLHDAHWSFLRLGNFIERADMTSRLLDAGCDDPLDDAAELEPFSDIQWRNVLLSLDATQSYNQVIQGPVNQDAVLDFLIHNPELPRSLAYLLGSMRNTIRHLPRNDRALRGINRLRRHIENTDLDGLDLEDVRQFLDDFQSQLAEVDSLIRRSYFTYKPRRRSAG
jgi:uncharacterized alpha-E superfamily protein